jgi:hypothetical protein
MADAIELLDGPAPPALSSDALTYYRERLGDADFQASSPKMYAMMKATVDQALGFTGQLLDLPVDPRVPADRLADRQMGIKRGPAGEVVLPEAIGVIVTRDVLDPPADAGEARRIIEASGRDYDMLLAQARTALVATGKTAPAGISVEKLSAHSLAQLAIFGAHLARRNPRPRN